MPFNSRAPFFFAEYTPPKGSPGVGGIKFAPLDCRDEDMVDHEIADYGVRQLNRRHEKPFFRSSVLSVTSASTPLLVIWPALMNAEL